MLAEAPQPAAQPAAPAPAAPAKAAPAVLPVTGLASDVIATLLVVLGLAGAALAIGMYMKRRRSRFHIEL